MRTEDGLLPDHTEEELRAINKRIMAQMIRQIAKDLCPLCKGVKYIKLDAGELARVEDDKIKYPNLRFTLSDLSELPDKMREEGFNSKCWVCGGFGSITQNRKSQTVFGRGAL